MYRTSLTLRWPAQRLQSGDAVVGSLDSLGGHMDCGGGVLILVAHTGVKGDAGEQRGGGLAGADDLGSLVTTCRLLNSSRSDDNPNGFTIEGFTIIENKDLQTIKR